MVSYLTARSTLPANRSGVGSALAFGASRRSGAPGGAAITTVNAARPSAAASRKRFIASVPYEDTDAGILPTPIPEEVRLFPSQHKVIGTLRLPPRRSVAEPHAVS